MKGFLENIVSSVILSGFARICLSVLVLFLSSVDL